MKFLIIAVLMLQTACSTLPTHKPEAPTVKLVDIDVVKLGIRNQELAVTLSVFNPNRFDLPVNTLAFSASSEEETVLSGSSDQRFLLTANDSTQLTINIVSDLGRMLGQLLAALADAQNLLQYSVTGFVKLDNWPARIAFGADKDVSLDKI